MNVDEEALQQRLERLEADQTDTGRRDGDDDDVSRLLAIAERYRHAPNVQPSREFRASARRRMLELIAASEAAKATARPRWFARRIDDRFSPSLIRVAAMIAFLLTLLGGGGTAVMAASPGSPLFSAKQAVEEVQVSLTRSPADRESLRWQIVGRRAQELLASLATVDSAAATVGYRDALELALQATSSEPVDLDRRLAEQEEFLRGIGGASSADLVGVLESVEAERLRLRVRNGWEEPVPATAPVTATTTPPTAEPTRTAEMPAGSGDQTEPERRQERVGQPDAAPVATPTSWVGQTATATPAPERNRQGDASTPVQSRPTTSSKGPTVTSRPTTSSKGPTVTSRPTSPARPAVTPTNSVGPTATTSRPGPKDESPGQKGTPTSTGRGESSGSSRLGDGKP